MKNIFIYFLIIYIPSFGQEIFNEQIICDGNTREYIIYIPENYSNSSLPLLIALHGGGGYAQEYMLYEADFRPVADTANFILVYPQALEDPNDDLSTNWMHKDPTNHDDVDFIEAIIDTISNNYLIDNSRIYLCGYSLGGMFCYSTACKLSDKITAIGSVAGGIFIGELTYCSPSNPISVITINGTLDDTHPYDDTEGIYHSVNEINSFWINHNMTDLQPIIEQVENINSSDGSYVEKYSWINGNECSEVQELKIVNGGHDWPSFHNNWGNQDIDACIEIWNFVSKFSSNISLDCNTNMNINKFQPSEKKLLKTIDVHGKTLKKNPQGIYFDIYNDGSVDKVIKFNNYKD